MSKFKLNEIYTSGMIFQRNRPICIEGEAFAPCEITATMGEDSTSQKVEAGKFCLKLPAREADRGLELTVATDGQEQKLDNIFIGEVWLAAGQSNMEWYLNICDPAEINPYKVNEDIRFYTVGRTLLSEYEPGYEWALGKDNPWAGCTEESAQHFSAVGYHFAHKLYEKLQVPVGIINCNIGGSSIFSWLPHEEFQTNKEIGEIRERYQNILADTDMAAAKEKFYKALDAFKPDWADTIPNISSSSHQCVVVYAVEEYGPYHYHAPGKLYYPMMEKVVSFPAKGMIWYQGETEAHEQGVRLYPHALKSLIGNAHAKQADAPADYGFHMVQLAPWDEPGAMGWPEFCNMQRQYHLDNPTRGIATIGDLGGGTDIHPPRKKGVGERLAFAALNFEYGIPTEFCGPLATEAKLVGDEIEISFAYDTEMHCNKEIGTFEVADESGKWVKVPAILRDNKVYASVKNVNFKPVEIRYEYVPHPTIGLFNGASIPASVFKLRI